MRPPVYRDEGIAIIDATNVYWSDPGRGAIMIAPR
jgi:hypothetical protein